MLKVNEDLQLVLYEWCCFPGTECGILSSFIPVIMWSNIDLDIVLIWFGFLIFRQDSTCFGSIRRLVWEVTWTQLAQVEIGVHVLVELNFHFTRRWDRINFCRDIGIICSRFVVLDDVPREGEAGVFVNLTVNTDVFVEASKDIFFDQDVLPIISNIWISVQSYAISLSNGTLIKVTLGFEVGLEETSYLLCFNLVWLIFEI